jgi:hypothetical protein
MKVDDLQERIPCNLEMLSSNEQEYGSFGLASSQYTLSAQPMSLQSQFNSTMGPYYDQPQFYLKGFNKLRSEISHAYSIPKQIRRVITKKYLNTIQGSFTDENGDE